MKCYYCGEKKKAFITVNGKLFCDECQRLIATEIVNIEPKEIIKEVEVIKEIIKEVVKEVVPKKKSRERISKETPNKEYILAIRGASDRNKTFTLSIEEYYSFKGKPCFYCGEKSTGIDRINSSIGYEFYNCVPACKTCNMMKWTHSIDEWTSHMRKVLIYRQIIKE